MINKLNKDDRLEYLVKLSIINNKYYDNKMGFTMFGFVAIILFALSKTLPALFCIVIFLIFATKDSKKFLTSMDALSNEYFEIKPRNKK
jgi:hypothetical protein